MDSSLVQGQCHFPEALDGEKGVCVQRGSPGLGAGCQPALTLLLWDGLWREGRMWKVGLERSVPSVAGEPGGTTRVKMSHATPQTPSLMSKTHYS